MAAARRGEKERETATEDGGGGGGRERLSCARLSLISFPNLRLSAFLYRGSRRVETLSSMSRHDSAEIQAFCLASCGFGFGTALRRAANSLSDRDGSVGGLTIHRLRPPRYRFVAARGALGKQPRTM